jgi:hypothetical protein
MTDTYEQEFIEAELNDLRAAKAKLEYPSLTASSLSNLNLRVKML